jgi:hypothetical protein
MQLVQLHRRDGGPASELDPLDHQPQPGHRRPAAPLSLGQRPQPHVSAGHRSGKADHVLAAAIRKRPRGHGLAPILRVVAHVDLVLGDRPVAAAGPG